MLDGFMDSLVQAFENHRPGITDLDAAEAGPRLQAFFADVYEKERPRLEQVIAAQVHLDPAQRDQMLADTDELVRRVLLPAYARVAGRFTVRERNDFYVTPSPWHSTERVGWAIGGLVVGFLAVEAPFIPIFAKEWMALFMIGGFVYPALRRWLSRRRYGADLEALVASADAEIFRLDVAFSSVQPAVEEAVPEPEPTPVKGRTRSS
jgi:hypothetical protein